MGTGKEWGRDPHLASARTGAQYLLKSFWGGVFPLSLSSVLSVPSSILSVPSSILSVPSSVLSVPSCVLSVLFSVLSPC